MRPGTETLVNLEGDIFHPVAVNHPLLKVNLRILSAYLKALFEKLFKFRALIRNS